MSKVPNTIESKLLDYLDGVLSDSETAELNEIIDNDPAIKQRLEELRLAAAILKSTSLEQPSRTFTQQVMEKLDDYPARSHLSVRKSIFLLAGILLTIGIAVVLSSAGIFDSTTKIDLTDMVDQNVINKSLPSFQLNVKWLVNSIIILNLAIAFFVLDKTILKPIFRERTRLHF